VRIENPIAFSFILQDDLYLLSNDKSVIPGQEIPEVLPEPVLETPALNFKYLGKHKKQYLIMVYYPGMEFMPENHLMPLENTLKRLGFSLDDVAILNLANYADVTSGQLTDFFTPQKLLILGQHALPSGFVSPKLNQATQVDQCRTLFTFSFDEMMDNNDNKKAFWEQMKLW
jgi:hypothetical protein